MNDERDDDELEALVAEQAAYYRALAPEHAEGGIPELGEEELTAGWHALNAKIDTFAPTGDVLELACGPGTWTELLLRHASTLTAVDASPEMLALAAEKVTAYRAVKVPHTPASLERRVADLGWRVAVEQIPGPFFCGTATPP